MNTEELEQSLRAEFEGQMTNALAKMRADVSDLQKNCESEFEKHRSQVDEAFRTLAEKMEAPVEFDSAFGETVIEHLRLARDEGAQITATAMGEAEKLSDGETNRDVEQLRSAINDIKGNSTQASILRALVDAAGSFAPRGAFFILKNDHIVGWRAFGRGDLADENAVRSIHFPVASETLLSDALNSLANVQGSYADKNENAKFLGPLSYGAPGKMYAVPLCARGRGVAVLYADGGEAEEVVNIAALETLVSVAGLRVELLASSIAAPATETAQKLAEADSEDARGISEAAAEEADEVVDETETAPEEANDVAETEAVEPVAEEIGEPETETQDAAATETSGSEYVGEVEVAPAEAESASEFEFERGQVEEPADEQSSEFAFSSNNFSEELPTVEAEAYEEPEQFEAVPVAETQAATSYRNRNVDLPIEVSEDERRPHSDARRFARLLVSEIRLYNEQKVVEGRESGDIYEMLREAIDRSRDMYEKRVQPDVAAKFDYFHYELVNNLAEGDEEKLGAGYLAVKA